MNSVKAAIAILSLGVCALIGALVAITGSFHGQEGKEQASVSQLQGALTQLQSQNKTLEGEVATATAAAAKSGTTQGTQTNAEIAHLGFCVEEDYDNTTSDVSNVVITSPQTTDGVPSCPTGQFVPVVPQKEITGGAGGNS
jgi:hypothetical protein